MAATASLKNAGLSGAGGSRSGNSYEVVYIVLNATGPADAVGAAYTQAGSDFGSTVTSDDGTVLHIGPNKFQEIGGSGATFHYEVTITYQGSELNPSPAGTVRIAGDTGGGSAHILQAKDEVAVYKSGSDAAPDFKGTINNTPDGVEGVDVGVPVFNFTVTVTFAAGAFPDAGDLYAITTKTNTGTWTVTDTVTGMSLTFLEGEVVCNGVKFGDTRTDGLMDVVYDMSASPNITNVTIGDITGIDKKGWEYLWVRYAITSSGVGANKAVISTPKFVIVDRVYDEATFPTFP